MQIHLDQITDEPFSWRDDQRVPVASLERPELLELGEISWGGEVAPTESGFLFRAELAYEQLLECTRCLSAARVKVASSIELLVQRRAAQPTVGEYALEEDDLSILYVDADELETQPILEEQLQLNIPMRVLCSDDCAGLCPTCGANQNKGPCGCAETQIDSRWAALGEIRDRLKD